MTTATAAEDGGAEDGHARGLLKVAARGRRAALGRARCCGSKPRAARVEAVLLEWVLPERVLLLWPMGQGPSRPLLERVQWRPCDEEG